MASILVIGAGELGNAVLKGLSTSLHRPSSNTLHVLLRPSTAATQEKVSTVRSLGAQVVEGDIVNDAVPHLSSIFSNFNTIICCSGLRSPPGTQKRIVEAVLQAGGALKRYFPWQFGMDYDVIGEGSSQDLFDEQLDVRRALRAQEEVDWVIVSMGLFTSFLFLKEFGVVDTQGGILRALGTWGNRITLTTADDIGRMVAELAYDPVDVSRQVVFIAGETLSYAQIADVVEKSVGGRTWTREAWGPEDLRRMTERNPDDGMAKYRSVFGAGKGVAWDVDKTESRKRGIELMGLEEYLEKNPLLGSA